MQVESLQFFSSFLLWTSMTPSLLVSAAGYKVGLLVLSPKLWCTTHKAFSAILKLYKVIPEP